jgi:hypothetical protein
MHSGHMLRAGTWPDHVRVNMGLAHVHDPEYLRQELLERALKGTHRHIPWLVFAIALSVQNA